LIWSLAKMSEAASILIVLVLNRKLEN